MKHIAPSVLLLAACSATTAHVSRRESDSAPGLDLQSLAEELCRDERVPGMSVVVYYDGAIQHRAAAGVRNLETGEPVRVDTVFQIGSISKSFTATLAYTLAEKGVLPIDTRIADVFPQLAAAGRPEYRDVDIRMLLSHTSGMPYKPAAEPDDAFAQLCGDDLQRRRRAYVEAALRDPPVGTPGAHYEYSGGAIIVAAMIEKVTGQSWEQLMVDRVLAPLGLSDARPAPGWNGAGARAWGHMSSTTGLAPALFDHEMAIAHGPAGSMEMSALDLVQFARIHFYNNPERPALLGRGSLADMQKRTVVGDAANGWFVAWEGWSNQKTVWHGGDTNLARAILVIAPKYEAAYAILVNASNDQVSAAVEKLETAIKSFLGGHLAARRPGLARLEATHEPVSVSASNYFHEMAAYAPDRAIDGVLTTRWATDDDQHAAWLELDLGEARSIGAALIREEYSPRVTSYELSVKERADGAYAPVARGTAIGDEIILEIAPSVRARYVRLDLAAGQQGGPTLSEFQVFAQNPY